VLFRSIKATDQIHCNILNRERFSKTELWNNIIRDVYSNSWSGGSFSNSHPILERINSQLPKHIRPDADGLSDIADIVSSFKTFAQDIDKNTIKTGIVALDKKLMMITGTSVGILAAPGGGKTSLAINICRNVNKMGEVVLFYSLDMNKSLLCLYQMQNLTGYDKTKLFKIVNEDPEQFAQISRELMKAYENVEFNFKFGITPGDIRKNIQDFEANTGKKVRVIIVDYLENIQPPTQYTDTVMGSGVVAQQIANIAADEDLLAITLMQPQKIKDVGEPIDSMRSIKGSSVTEQSLTAAIGLYRIGQKLKYNQWDNYITANILKNRLGSLGTVDMFFDGAKSLIRDMTDKEKQGLIELKARIEADKQAEDEERRSRWSGGGGTW
jgi:replicative DNA helicase